MQSDRLEQSFFNTCVLAGIGIKGEGHYSFDKHITTHRLVLGFGNIDDEILDEGLNKLIEIIDTEGLHET